MRYGIFSDVHGNREALMAVLEALQTAGASRLINRGDTVGYGAEARRGVLTPTSRSYC